MPGLLAKNPHDLTADERQRLVFVEWVSGLTHWHSFGTFTFAKPVECGNAARIFERFFGRTEFAGVDYFYGVEANPGGVGSHVHFVLGGKEPYLKGIWQEWFNRYGRNRIELIEDRGCVESLCSGRIAAVNYCAKYCTKAGLWWNIRVANRFEKGFKLLP